ncbi:cell wall-associated hydrolase, invasion-associated protein [Mycolicibacterium chubuense NBB4]|uniref:Cell wall-associated hydrolase, invasion-associated protein n=1 Tax=Mycolicibacterium chubuense (strain NBB4) TaxID=710421 RepID=I4BFG2_MYCCN|nr:C40 family peptidase [Mycolicibacterium chubuense]AFM16019.1 cell wall-associated hydrolase, invasion-associated protein [Mycolicibacterium chubuense NBB4]
MPADLVTTLAAPIRRVQALVGPGWSGDPAADPAAVLAGVRDTLAGVAESAGRAWRDVDAGWSGAGADAAAEFATTTAAAIDGAAERAGRLGVSARDAAAAVADARRRLQDIVDEFDAKAAALEPHLDQPGVAKELLAAARDALGRAIAIVEDLQAELDRHAAALGGPGSAGAPAATTPAGWPGGAGSGPGAGVGSGPGQGAGGGFGSGSGFGSGASPAAWGSPEGGPADLAGFTTPDGADPPDASMFGDGVAVRLPDGTVVMAPNAVAAGAVRYALTQLGVPYRWGGTAPGVGLDCSGLTQWAYHEAGLDLPRLAQEQDIGAPVPAGSLLPGDLAVWDGHVAMIVGDGTMIEAGDPVTLSPIRTSNAGQGFQGFWRPTA